MFCVISVYFNIRNTLSKSGTFLLGHPVCNYLFECRLEFKNVVLREIFGGEMEKLTGGWREL